VHTRSSVAVDWAEKNVPAWHVALCGWHALTTAVANVEVVAAGE